MLEMMPGLAVWLTFLAAILVSLVAPLWAIIFILVFDVYWLVRVLYVMVYVLLAFRRFRQASQVHWFDRLRPLPGWRQVYHLVIVPVSVEPLAVLTNTFDSLARVDYPHDRLMVVVATEARHATSTRPNAAALLARYEREFFRFMVVEHPADIPGELAAKGANIAWAGRRAQDEIDRLRIPYSQVLVSTFDADSVAHPQYFSYLTHTFLKHPQRWRTSYQPIPVFHNNIWDALFLMRVVANSTTFWLLSETVRPDRLFTFSSHSMPFQALVDVGFWQTDLVSEDSRIFIQCFLHYDGQYSVTPLYLPISMDTVQGGSWWLSIRNQYRQIQRWAYGGVENFPFSVWNFVRSRAIPWRQKVKYTWIQWEGIYSWATAPILIFLLGWLPFVGAEASGQTSAIVQNAPAMLRSLMTMAMVGLIVSAILSTIILPVRPQHVRWFRWVMMIGQWLFLPLTMIIFGSVPALDAQSRMLFGKYLGFVITEKTRRPLGSPHSSFEPSQPG